MAILLTLALEWPLVAMDLVNVSVYQVYTRSIQLVFSKQTHVVSLL